MTPANRQRLKRQRRAEAGMVKVELWIHADEAAWLKDMAAHMNQSLSETVALCVTVVAKGSDR